MALLNTTPDAHSSFSAPPRTIYHQIARDVMLVQGIHYAVEEDRRIGVFGPST